MDDTLTRADAGYLLAWATGTAQFNDYQLLRLRSLGYLTQDGILKPKGQVLVNLMLAVAGFP